MDVLCWVVGCVTRVELGVGWVQNGQMGLERVKVLVCGVVVARLWGWGWSRWVGVRLDVRAWEGVK